MSSFIILVIASYLLEGRCFFHRLPYGRRRLAVARYRMICLVLSYHLCVIILQNWCLALFVVLAMFFSLFVKFMFWIYMYSRPWASKGFVYHIRPNLWLILFDRDIDMSLGNANWCFICCSSYLQSSVSPLFIRTGIFFTRFCYLLF